MDLLGFASPCLRVAVVRIHAKQTQFTAKGTNVQNEPNFLLAGRKGQGPATLPKPTPPDQNVQNEANFLSADTRDKSFIGKELRRIGRTGDLGKTKPIRGGAAWVEVHGTRAVGCCTNKPNLRTRPEIGASRQSHQQSGPRGRSRQTNPICRRETGKTIAKAAGLDAATPQGQSAPNEANLLTQAQMVKWVK